MKLILYIFSIIAVGVLSFSAFSQTYIPGNTYIDSTGYVEYRAGNLPIIISVPHGGTLEPSSIPDLSCNGTPSGFIDSYTKEIAEGLYTTFYQETGCYPHIIFNLLHKKKFQANGNLNDAACGNPTVEEAWYNYHDFIDSAKAQIVEDYNRGLFLDIHGHAHTIERIELGYLLSKSELQLSDSDLNTNTYVEESSIRKLVSDNIQDYTHSELLRGQYSFGTLMDQKGFPSVPSFSDPFPQQSEPYFTGGYNTQRHGSRDNNGEIDAIQIEFNQDIRFDSDMRALLIDSLTSSINEYINYHYNDQFMENFCGLILGGSEQEKIDLKLYPNPATDYFYLSGQINNAELIIVNSFGQEVVSEDWSNDIIKIKDLPTGLYFVKVISNHRTLNTLKLIKE